MNLYGLKMKDFAKANKVGLIETVFTYLDKLRHSKGSQQVLREQREKFKKAEAARLEAEEIAKTKKKVVIWGG